MTLRAVLIEVAICQIVRGFGGKLSLIRSFEPYVYLAVLAEANKVFVMIDFPVPAIPFNQKMQLLSSLYVHALICFSTSVCVSSRHSGSSCLLEASNGACTVAGRWSTDSLSSVPVSHRVRFDRMDCSVARSPTCMGHSNRILDEACVVTQLETLIVGSAGRGGRTRHRRRHQSCLITVPGGSAGY